MCLWVLAAALSAFGHGTENPCCVLQPQIQHCHTAISADSPYIINISGLGAMRSVLCGLIWTDIARVLLWFLPTNVNTRICENILLGSQSGLKLEVVTRSQSPTATAKLTIAYIRVRVRRLGLSMLLSVSPWLKFLCWLEVYPVCLIVCINFLHKCEYLLHDHRYIHCDLFHPPCQLYICTAPKVSNENINLNTLNVKLYSNGILVTLSGYLENYSNVVFIYDFKYIISIVTEISF